MKKNALVIAGLTLMSTSAFASKARVEALGNNAPYYISDKREVFSNPATINTHKNYVVAELGHSNVAADSIDKPRAEGGFFREAGSIAYGLYLGNNENTGDRVKSTTAAGYLSQDNAVDLFIGGDAGIQWGAKLHYANSKNETATAAAKRTNSAFGFGLGTVFGSSQVYTDVTLSDKSEGDGTNAGYVYKTKPSFLVGALHEWAGNTFFVEFASGKVELSEATTADLKSTNIIVGVGRQMEVNATSRAFGNIAFNLEKSEDGTDKETYTIIPVAVGFEADATSWLTLRGSIGQNFVLNDKKEETATTTTKSTNPNTTEVNAGLSVNLGKMNIDGSVGQITGSGTNDRLISRVGVVYNF